VALTIAPSILSADFARLGEHVTEALEAGARRIHVDIMDGQFVPNLTMGPQHVAALRPLADRYGAILEAHLMIVEPDRFLGDFRAAGTDVIEVHVEACPHLHRTTQAIRALGASPAVGLNPATPLGTLDEILPDLDQVLLMSVNPGFGGQAFIPGSLDKIRRLRHTLAERGLDHIAIEVDGGVNLDTIGAVAEAGATIAVAGNALFAAGCAVSEAWLRLTTAAAAGS